MVLLIFILIYGILSNYNLPYYLAMAKTKTPEVLTKIISLLTPLESDERKRVISAAMTFLGETKIDFGKNGSVGGNGDEDTTNFPSKVKTWMGQNSITKDELDQVFNIEDGKAEVIASEVPGKSIKRKTLNAYILAGINSFLTSGNLSFDDKSARATCVALGCYDSTNHATNIKDKGNKIAGSKNKGWKLTAPGLKNGAELIKEITKSK